MAEDNLSAPAEPVATTPPTEDELVEDISNLLEPPETDQPEEPEEEAAPTEEDDPLGLAEDVETTDDTDTADEADGPDGHRHRIIPRARAEHAQCQSFGTTGEDCGGYRQCCAQGR